MTKVCLFDIDGTLVSTSGAGKAALETALQITFGLTELRGTVDYSGRTDLAITCDLLRMHELPDDPATRRRLHEAYLQQLPLQLARKTGRVLPGIADLLERLGAHGDVRLGLLTGNLNEGAKVKLGHFDLMKYFPFGGFGDDHLHRDDVARAALQATRRYLQTEIEPEQVWVIGDTPLDVQCARAIGARVLAVATGMHPVAELEATRPDLLLRDLAQAEPFLDRLFD